jgi:hypothetical protein
VGLGESGAFRELAFRALTRVDSSAQLDAQGLRDVAETWVEGAWGHTLSMARDLVEKRPVSLNAVKHGLGAALDVLVPGESRALYDAWESAWTDELEPVGSLEGFLVHRIATGSWRLLRVERLEGSLASSRIRELLNELAAGVGPRESQGWALPDAKSYDGLARLARHESAIERSFFRCLRELEFLQDARRRRGLPAPAVGFRPPGS